MKAERKAIWRGCAGLALALGLCLAVPLRAAGQGEINLTSSSYAQNFDVLGVASNASLPPGFLMTQKNITSPQSAQWTNTSNFGTTTVAASNGTPTTGGRYNWGATGGTDRAIGFMNAGAYLGYNGILAGFTNNTGNTITQIVAGFVWEQYRINTNTVTNACYFSVDPDHLNWAPLSSNLYAAGTSAYGYPLSTTTVSVTKGNLSVTNGGKFYFLFYFSEQYYQKGQGWGVDDLSLMLQFYPEIALSDNAPQVGAGSVVPGATDHVLHRFKLAAPVANATLTNVYFSTEGSSFMEGDVLDFKVYYSTDSTLEVGSDTLLGTKLDGLYPGRHGLLSLSQEIAAGSTGYIFITADIAPGATVDKTIRVNEITTNDVFFSAGRKTGSTTAGGVQTIRAGACTPGPVPFTQQTNNYIWTATDGDYSDNNGAVDLVVYEPGLQVVGWRDFKTLGSGGGEARHLRPGDRFRISLSGDSRPGVLGVSLNEGTATNSWTDRYGHTRGYIECSNSPNIGCFDDPEIDGDECNNLPGDLTVTSQAGGTSWTNINPLGTNVTLEFFILSSREFTANVVGQTPKCDLTMLNDPGDEDWIDGFSIYCEKSVDSDYTNIYATSVSWQQETVVTNLGYVEFGADDGTRTIAGKITDGSSPACTNSPSPNRLIKSGSGTITLGNTNNTYTLDTVISNGTLQIAADTCLGAVPGLVSNAHIKLVNGATLAGTENFTLNAKRGIAIGTGTGHLAVAEAKTMIYAGAINGPGALTKNGEGTLELAGANTFGGATTVGAGTLLLSGSLSNSAVTVAPGATLMGAGSASTLTVSGTVDPGNSVGARATLSCGALTLNAGGALRVDLSNATGTPGTDWDQLSAAGAINANASGTFTIRLCGTPAGFSATQGYRWEILSGASVANFSASRFLVNTENFLSATDGGTFSVNQSGTEVVLDYAPRTPSVPAFSAMPASVSSMTLTFSSTDPVVIVGNGTGSFATPTGTAPSAGNAFAGGTVVYNGSSSPQTHAGLSSCTPYYYSAWSYNGTNYSSGAVSSGTTWTPAAPAGLVADPTNSTDFTARWSASTGASGYRLDVSTNEDFWPFQPGYSNRAVSGTDQNVTGLTGATPYYFRVRAEGAGGCASANSATSSATTLIQDQTIDFPPIADQLATNGVALAATATSGLPVDFAVLSGPGSIAGANNLTFTGAGAVSIVASQTGNAHWNPAPGQTNTFNVSKATAGVTLGNLSRIHDGLPKGATVTTDPAGLAVDVTYDGLTDAPSAVGSYEVVAAVTEARYAGGATGTLTIAEETVTNKFEKWLQQEQGLDPEDSRYAPDADDDRDGMTTWEEFLADTDPAMSGSVLRVTGTYSTVSHQIRLAFPASSNRFYQLIYSTNLSQGNSQSNLGWGIPGMSITNYSLGGWYGGIRSMLTNPVSP